MRSIKKTIAGRINNILIHSLVQSTEERGETSLKNRLMSIVPDISEQYTTFRIDSKDNYINTKVRAQHTFQTSLTLKTIELLINKTCERKIKIVDIGDSSGTHLRYLEGLKEDYSIEIQSMSVNLDPEAVRKIKSQGLDAMQCRAEELHLVNGGVSADVFLSFQMLEHLFDPVSFLHSMAVHAACSYFVITVPYVKTSRVGLHHLRNNLQQEVWAENTHIFELCPGDWDLIFRFSGWEIAARDLYKQYPSSGLLSWTKYLWRRLDFEGFYGVILKKSSDDSKYYRSW